MNSIIEPINVVIPTYNDSDSLTRCLDAIAVQSIPKDFLYVWVVNNRPSVPLILKEYLFNLKVINEERIGSYAARNAAIKSINSGIIIFTDSDCVPDVNWISTIIEKSSQKHGILVGKIKIYLEKHGKTLAYDYERIFSFNQRLNASRKRTVTANMACDKSVFDKVGLFNEKLLSGGDFEWSSRASKAGIDFYFCPSAIISHPARKDISSLFRKTRRIARSGLAFSQSREKKNNLYLFNFFKLPIRKLWAVIFSDVSIITKCKLILLVILIHEYDVYQRLLYTLRIASSVRE